MTSPHPFRSSSALDKASIAFTGDKARRLNDLSPESPGLALLDVLLHAVVCVLTNSPLLHNTSAGLQFRAPIMRVCELSMTMSELEYIFESTRATHA